MSLTIDPFFNLDYSFSMQRIQQKWDYTGGFMYMVEGSTYGFSDAPFGWWLNCGLNTNANTLYTAIGSDFEHQLCATQILEPYASFCGFVVLVRRREHVMLYIHTHTLPLSLSPNPLTSREECLITDDSFGIVFGPGVGLIGKATLQPSNQTVLLWNIGQFEALPYFDTYIETYQVVCVHVSVWCVGAFQN